MLHLMKYEVRRQLFSKGVIAGTFLVLVAAFFGFYWKGNVPGISIALSLLGVETTCVLLFAPIEHWFLFHTDIHSRQGYMLFTLSKKPTAILGAKVLVGLLQTSVLYGIFFSVVPYCERMAADKYGFATGYVSNVADTIIEMMHSANAGIAPALGVWLPLVVTVLFFSNLGLFIIAVPLPLDKAKGLVRFCGYIVAFALLVFIEIKAKDLLVLMTDSQMAEDIFEILYFVGVNLALFFGTAKLLENEVSIE